MKLLCAYYDLIFPTLPPLSCLPSGLLSHTGFSLACLSLLPDLSHGYLYLSMTLSMSTKLDGGGCKRSLTEEAPRRDFSDDKHGLTSSDLCCLLPEVAPPKFTIQSDDKHVCTVDVRSSKVCGIGLLNNKAQHVFHPFERDNSDVAMIILGSWFFLNCLVCFLKKLNMLRLMVYTY
ncbi:hypothetical protein IGI04_006938 [Brassica rapa subsp. trilocularis]|uniref:Uncharacterized protein n=1 Tax=Brassica rapa subsp. trilocularis TaxID=1813537 RepID=A0ABQ7NID6_BRACM|nr:hypothetical protein IGI04_006938 [Brassica rapa subsp. trilocularis]